LAHCVGHPVYDVRLVHLRSISRGGPPTRVFSQIEVRPGSAREIEVKLVDLRAEAVKQHLSSGTIEVVGAGESVSGSSAVGDPPL
jgi:hypothetical protein